MTSKTNYDELGFIDLVVLLFDFLEHDFDYELVSASPQRVRYVNGAFFVEIFHESGVNVLFGRRVQLRDTVPGLWKRLRHEWGIEFPLEYLAEDLGKTNELDPARLRIENRGDLEVQLSKLSAFVKAFAHDLLSHDPRAYKRMARIDRQRTKELTKWASG
jgi:hypothetical protein